ncbi:unnamed protein product [Dovyalis caffra]|uniref:Uncharacterized protein n=1 Tax=Dovyalis caffra TaxID=77055 RepID=A0AAV1R9G3_9ROSI|nr:unnamed protein product [Dovyalis caffra]
MACLSSQKLLKDKQTRDANSITSLSLTHRALSDISCLREFQNLEKLDLAFNNLTSLQGLSSCVKLKWLSVVQNKLESLRGIEALSNLTVLNAGKNKLKSIDEVRSLVSLRALILNDNDIVSICKLDQMKELNTVGECWKCALFDWLERIAFCSLAMSNKMCEHKAAVLKLTLDIIMVQDFQGSISINCFMEHVEGHGVYAGTHKNSRFLWDNNTSLVLSRNPIREIGESLVKVKSITKLSLSNCQLQTIDSSLKSCIELKELRLAHNDIKTLPTELAYNKKLQNLDLGNNVITRWSDVKVLSSLVDLKNLNLQGNPIVENAKTTKKVQKFLPNLHIFNARPVDKSTKKGSSGRPDDSSLIPTNELDDLKEKEKDCTRETKSSKHVMDQRSGHFDNADDEVEKDLKQRRKKTKGEVSKKEEASTDEKDDNVVEKKLKRKKTNEKEDPSNDLEMEDLRRKGKKSLEKLSEDDVHDDDRNKVKRKLKSKKSREELNELDIIDNGEVSFADLFSVDAAENPKHGSESKTLAKTGINAPSGLLTVSAKKKKSKNQGLVSTIPLSPAVEVGMGGTSTWGDE